MKSWTVLPWILLLIIPHCMSSSSLLSGSSTHLSPEHSSSYEESTETLKEILLTSSNAFSASLVHSSILPTRTILTDIANTVSAFMSGTYSSLESILTDSSTYVYSKTSQTESASTVSFETSYDSFQSTLKTAYSSVIQLETSFSGTLESTTDIQLETSFSDILSSSSGVHLNILPSSSIATIETAFNNPSFTNLELETSFSNLFKSSADLTSSGTPDKLSSTAIIAPTSSNPIISLTSKETLTLTNSNRSSIEANTITMESSHDELSAITTIETSASVPFSTELSSKITMTYGSYGTPSSSVYGGVLLTDSFITSFLEDIQSSVSSFTDFSVMTVSESSILSDDYKTFTTKPSDTLSPSISPPAYLNSFSQYSSGYSIESNSFPVNEIGNASHTIDSHSSSVLPTSHTIEKASELFSYTTYTAFSTGTFSQLSTPFARDISESSSVRPVAPTLNKIYSTSITPTPASKSLQSDKYSGEDFSSILSNLDTNSVSNLSTVTSARTSYMKLRSLEESSTPTIILTVDFTSSEISGKSDEISINGTGMFMQETSHLSTSQRTSQVDAMTIDSRDVLSHFSENDFTDKTVLLNTLISSSPITSVRNHFISQSSSSEIHGSSTSIYESLSISRALYLSSTETETVSSKRLFSSTNEKYITTSVNQPVHSSHTVDIKVLSVTEGTNSLSTYGISTPETMTDTPGSIKTEQPTVFLRSTSISLYSSFFEPSEFSITLSSFVTSAGSADADTFTMRATELSTLTPYVTSGQEVTSQTMFTDDISTSSGISLSVSSQTNAKLLKSSIFSSSLQTLQLTLNPSSKTTVNSLDIVSKLSKSNVLYSVVSSTHSFEKSTHALYSTTELSAATRRLISFSSSISSIPLYETEIVQDSSSSMSKISDRIHQTTVSHVSSTSLQSNPSSVLLYTETNDRTTSDIFISTSSYMSSKTSSSELTESLTLTSVTKLDMIGSNSAKTASATSTPDVGLISESTLSSSEFDYSLLLTSLSGQRSYFSFSTRMSLVSMTSEIFSVKSQSISTETSLKTDDFNVSTKPSMNIITPTAISDTSGIYSIQSSFLSESFLPESIYLRSSSSTLASLIKPSLFTLVTLSSSLSTDLGSQITKLLTETYGISYITTSQSLTVVAGMTSQSTQYQPTVSSLLSVDISSLTVSLRSPDQFSLPTEVLSDSESVSFPTSGIEMTLSETAISESSLQSEARDDRLMTTISDLERSTKPTSVYSSLTSFVPLFRTTTIVNESVFITVFKSSANLPPSTSETSILSHLVTSSLRSQQNSVVQSSILPNKTSSKTVFVTSTGMLSPSLEQSTENFSMLTTQPVFSSVESTLTTRYLSDTSVKGKNSTIAYSSTDILTTPLTMTTIGLSKTLILVSTSKQPFSTGSESVLTSFEPFISSYISSTDPLSAIETVGTSISQKTLPTSSNIFLTTFTDTYSVSSISTVTVYLSRFTDLSTSPLSTKDASTFSHLKTSFNSYSKMSYITQFISYSTSDISSSHIAGSIIASHSLLVKSSVSKTSGLNFLTSTYENPSDTSFALSSLSFTRMSELSSIESHTYNILSLSQSSITKGSVLSTISIENSLVPTLTIMSLSTYTSSVIKTVVNETSVSSESFTNLISPTTSFASFNISQTFTNTLSSTMSDNFSKLSETFTNITLPTKATVILNTSEMYSTLSNTTITEFTLNTNILNASIVSYVSSDTVHYTHVKSSTSYSFSQLSYSPLFSSISSISSDSRASESFLVFSASSASIETSYLVSSFTVVSDSSSTPPFIFSTLQTSDTLSTTPSLLVEQTTSGVPDSVVTPALTSTTLSTSSINTEKIMNTTNSSLSTLETSTDMLFSLSTSLEFAPSTFSVSTLSPTDKIMSTTNSSLSTMETSATYESTDMLFSLSTSPEFAHSTSSVSTLSPTEKIMSTTNSSLSTMETSATYESTDILFSLSTSLEFAHSTFSVSTLSPTEKIMSTTHSSLSTMETSATYVSTDMLFSLSTSLEFAQSTFSVSPFSPTPASKTQSSVVTSIDTTLRDVTSTSMLTVLLSTTADSTNVSLTEKPSKSISLSLTFSTMTVGSYSTSLPVVLTPSSIFVSSSSLISTTTEPPTTTPKLNGTNAKETHWIRTVLKIQRSKNISAATFVSELERNFADAYNEAFIREKLIQEGKFEPLQKRRRRKRYTTVGDASIHIHEVSRIEDTSTVMAIYAVERSGRVLTADEAVAALDVLNTQELAIILKEVVDVKAEPYSQTENPVEQEESASRLWLIGVICGSVAGVIIVIWIIVCIYCKCCRNQDAEEDAEPELTAIHPQTSKRKLPNERSLPSYPPKKTLVAQGSKFSLKKGRSYEVNDAYVPEADTEDQTLLKSPTKKKPPSPKFLNGSASGTPVLSKKEQVLPTELLPPTELVLPLKKGRRNSRNSIGPLSGDVELINEVSKVKSGKNDRSQMFQSSVSEDSEDTKKQLKADRKKNKERLNELYGQKHDPRVGTQETTKKILGMPNTAVPSLVIESGTPAKGKNIPFRRHSFQDGNTSADENLEEARSRMHKLLDDAFSLISPRESFTENDIRKSSGSTSTNSIDDKPGGGRQATMSVVDIDKAKETIKGFTNPAYTSSYSEFLETWSPYRASDQVALISMPYKPEPTVTKLGNKSDKRPATSRAGTYTGKRPAVNLHQESSKSVSEITEPPKYTTSSPKPIVLRTKDDISPGRIDSARSSKAPNDLKNNRTVSSTPFNGDILLQGSSTSLTKSDLPSKPETKDLIEMKHVGRPRSNSIRKHRVPAKDNRHRDELDVIQNIKPEEVTDSLLRSIRDELKSSKIETEEDINKKPIKRKNRKAHSKPMTDIV